jgi:predicted  nucleic acid-binding Zn-ribbon protein
MAMDYEYQITLLEKELAHYKEMQSLIRQHLDAHDASFEAVGNRMDRIEANLDRAASLSVSTEAKIQAVSEKLDRLVDVLLRSHKNGQN